MSTTTTKYILLSYITLLFLTQSLFAQNAQQKWGIGANYHLRYLPTLSPTAPTGKQIEWKSAYGIYFARYVAPWLNAQLSAAWAPVCANNSPSQWNGLTDLDFALAYTFNNGYIINETSPIAPYVKLGIGTYLSQVGVEGAETLTPQMNLPMGGGIKARVWKRLNVHIHATHKKGLGANGQNYTVFSAGFIVDLGREFKRNNPLNFVSANEAGAGIEKRDKDKDGVADQNDPCPNQKGTANGCPDADRDGIPDKEDKCPYQAGELVHQGCPYTKDSDIDGIPDIEDRCPHESGLAHLQGCPDSDFDGIANPDDECPKQEGIAALGGCPDSDFDGIRDIDDKCPFTYGVAESAGCPKVEVEAVAAKSTALPKSHIITFPSGSKKLPKAAELTLDQVVNQMIADNSLSVKVEGYTDSAGDAKTNKTLSTKRAKLCTAYLTQRGIASDRITTQGYGEENPIADNNTPEGRAKNRRVELIPYKMK